MSGGSLFSVWYFDLPNFILAALMYTLLGRALLGLIVQPDSSNYIWRFFCRITDPFVAAVALVTPKAAAPVVIWLFGVDRKSTRLNSSHSAKSRMPSSA